jgi:hypothetical protein
MDFYFTQLAMICTIYYLFWCSDLVIFDHWDSLESIFSVYQVPVIFWAMIIS